LSLLNKEHIADSIFRKLKPNNENYVRFDIHDDYFIYATIIGNYKPILFFYDGYIEVNVLCYNHSTGSYDTLDTICKINETPAKEYSETLEVLYSTGKFMPEHGDALRSVCRDLAIESQIASGSLFSKFVDWS
jgi:hypothetical protein